MVDLQRSAAVLPVRDVAAALAHYERLGFAVRPYAGAAAYGFVERGGVQLHLSEVRSVDPATNLCSVYLYIDDADALHAEWSAAGVGGRLTAPTNREWGLREGTHVDPDGNLLRFGSPLAP